MSKWIQKKIKNKLTPSYEHSAVIYHNVMYIYGGEEQGQGYHHNLFKLDLVNLDKWEPVQFTGKVKTCEKATHTAVVYQDSMYVLNGWTPYFTQRVVQEFHEYDFKKKTWKTLTSTDGPKACYGHKAVVYGDSMFVYGGYDWGSTVFETLYEYDFQKGTWKTLKPTGDLPGPRFYHQMCVQRDKIYLFGGQKSDRSTTTQGDMFVYDPQANHWRKIETEVKRAYAELVPINSTYLMLFGGWEETDNFDDTLLWNIHHEKFEKLHLSFHPSQRFSYSGVCFGNQVYLLGGKNGSTYYDDLYEFVFKEHCLNFRYVIASSDIHFRFQ